MIKLSEAVEACKISNYHLATAITALASKGHARREVESAIDTIFHLVATTRDAWEDDEFYTFTKE